MANSYYSDFGKERSGVKGSLPSPGARKYQKVLHGFWAGCPGGNMQNCQILTGYG